ncbi:hypothetical protein CYMTET_34935, partial [Cymbomonas tetramitiformis]
MHHEELLELRAKIRSLQYDLAKSAKVLFSPTSCPLHPAGSPLATTCRPLPELKSEKATSAELRCRPTPRDLPRPLSAEDPLLHARHCRASGDPSAPRTPFSTLGTAGPLETPQRRGPPSPRSALQGLWRPTQCSGLNGSLCGSGLWRGAACAGAREPSQPHMGESARPGVAVIAAQYTIAGHCKARKDGAGLWSKDGAGLWSPTSNLTSLPIFTPLHPFPAPTRLDDLYKQFESEKMQTASLRRRLKEAQEKLEAQEAKNDVLLEDIEYLKSEKNEAQEENVNLKKTVDKKAVVMKDLKKLFKEDGALSLEEFRAQLKEKVGDSEKFEAMEKGPYGYARMLLWQASSDGLKLPNLLPFLKKNGWPNPLPTYDPPPKPPTPQTSEAANGIKQKVAKRFSMVYLMKASAQAGLNVNFDKSNSMTEPEALALIMDIYTTMYEQYSRGQPNPMLSEYVYDYYLMKYEVPSVAERQLLNTVESLRQLAGAAAPDPDPVHSTPQVHWPACAKHCI